jgi:hypothetical protein
MKDSEFISGQKVRLDADMAHSSIVEVMYQSEKRLVTWVKSDRSQWMVGTYRLSPIVSDSSAKICKHEWTKHPNGVDECTSCGLFRW